jgi:hypothetical protein
MSYRQPNGDGGPYSGSGAPSGSHCFTGCAIGEVLGMALATGFGWGNLATIAVSVLLAFVFGYAFSMRPLLAGGIALGQALRLALAADTVSILTMELVDNSLMVAIPGAIDATLSDPLFWTSLALSLAIAFVAAFPVNRWLIRRGRGHAAMHAHHAH